MSTITREFTKERLIKRLEEQESGTRYALSVVQDSEILRDIEMDLHLIKITLASLKAEPASVNDDMAYAFHHALSDSSIGADDVEETKAGLRAALANFTAPPAPAPAVPLTATTEHRRVIEMLLSVCGAAFELADDACEAEIDGEVCLTVLPDAFRKLSDSLDEIEATLPTEDPDRPDVFLAWAAMPRAALKSLLYTSPPAPVVPGEAISLAVDGIMATYADSPDECRKLVRKHIEDACRTAMLQSEPAGRDYRAIVERIAEIMHGSVTDVDLLTVTVLSMKQKSEPVIHDDTRRMDWLVSKTVNVREPMVYGSHDLFWSQTISEDWEEEHKTTLREQIDAAMDTAPKGV